MPLAILNADDLGYDPEVSRGILEALSQGIVSSATLLVNTPYSEEAARAGRAFALGLHLNLARGAPISTALRRRDAQLDETRAPLLSTEEIEAEVIAQLDRFQALCRRPPTHVDVHKHLHRHPNVLDGLASACRARALPVRSIDARMRARLRTLGVATNPHFVGDAGAEAYWTLARLEEALAQLPATGVTELMCHPGYAPRTLTSRYSQQREVELRTFTHPSARELLTRYQVQLVDFRAVS